MGKQRLAENGLFSPLEPEAWGVRGYPSSFLMDISEDWETGKVYLNINKNQQD
jgi:hypothetical protein